MDNLDSDCRKLVELEDGIMFCTMCQQFVSDVEKETTFKLLLSDGKNSMECFASSLLLARLAPCLNDPGSDPTAIVQMMDHTLYHFGIVSFQSEFKITMICLDPSPRYILNQSLSRSRSKIQQSEVTQL